MKIFLTSAKTYNENKDTANIINKIAFRTKIHNICGKCFILVKKFGNILLRNILRCESLILTKLVSFEIFCHKDQELHRNYLSESNCSKVLDKKRKDG